MNPVIVAELTVIVHVASDTTRPGTALASFGVVGDGDGLPDEVLPSAGGVPGRPAAGVGPTGARRPPWDGARALTAKARPPARSPANLGWDLGPRGSRR